MPATTRSKTNPSQSRLEYFATSKRVTSSSTTTTSPSRKRKAPHSTQANAKKISKVQNIQQLSGQAETSTKVGSKNKIIINRAPVLTLWAACVAHFLHPSIPWEPTAISAGAAISAICAISKGRSIGEIAEKDKTKESSKDKHKENERDQSRHLSVMKFNLKLDARNGFAEVSGKLNKQNEINLQKKFGEKAYEATKSAFEESLSHWRGHEEELDGKAFGMYEQFRPTVQAGSQGWGRKGELDLDFVKSEVDRQK